MTPDEVKPVSRGRLIIKAAIRFPMALIVLRQGRGQPLIKTGK